MRGQRLRTVAVAGDLLLLAAFPFLGTLEHGGSVTLDRFVRTVVPFAVAWLAIGALAQAMALPTIRSVRRTYLRVPPAWIAAGIIAIAIRVIVFDRPFSLAFALVSIAVAGALIIGWRLLLAATLGRR